MDKVNLPLVSVVIPTYNRLGTLPASVNSVLTQTYENLELIIVDDGSSDGTGEYVKGIKDGRVKYVRSAGNNGPAAARNMGAKIAAGDYLAFHDSDDEWMPDKLEKQMSLMLNSEKEIHLVYCEYDWYANGVKRVVVPSREIPYENKCGNIFQVLLSQSLIGTPTMVIKRQDFLVAGGFNEELKTLEDYEFTLRFSQNHEIGFVEEALVKVNEQPGSVNKRYVDRIRTQAYMIREMIIPLREYDLLWQKLSEMQCEADGLKCYNVFMEEMHQLWDLFTTEEEQGNALTLLKIMTYDRLIYIKRLVLKEYLRIFENRISEPDNFQEIAYQMECGFDNCMELFQVPADIQRDYETAKGKMTVEGKVERLSLLTEIVGIAESLEKYIIQQMQESMENMDN